MHTNKIIQIISIIAIFTAGCSNNKKVEHELFNTTASPQETVGNFDAAAILNWHMVTLLKDTKNNSIMVLYANDQAYKSVQQGNANYEAGSVLSLVSWLEKADLHWFGATIPGEITSIEQVSFVAAEKQSTFSHYASYLKKANGFAIQQNQDSLLAKKKANFILALRRPYLPD